MQTVFKKLGFRPGSEILLLNEPEHFSMEFCAPEKYTVVGSLIRTSSVNTVLIFVENTEEIENQWPTLSPKLTDKAILWFAIPEKKFKHFDWTFLKEMDFEACKEKTIDAEWQAVRFKRVRFLKRMYRKTKQIAKKLSVPARKD